jgi:hypothetical protein
MEPSAADGSSGPIAGLLACYPAGVLLLRDSLAAAGHFLLPWIGAASVKQGHKVRGSCLLLLLLSQRALRASPRH